jgi:hippurate hydrolase
VVVGSKIVAAIQSIVARNARPTDTLVISVTKFHSGEAYNVIPHTARLGGTVRCFSNEVMKLAEDRIRQIANGIAHAFGATATLDFRRIFDTLVNDADETQFCADIAAGLVGEENVNRNRSLVMASEDFSFMLQQRPGAFIYIGNGDGPEACMVHNPGYDFNDEILALGATYWVKLAEEKLAKDELAE